MKRSLPVLLALVVGVVLAQCHQALFTAPAGSTLDVTANPEFIPAHGGVSVITAVVIEPAGTPVADGTVVQFFTTLGHIDEQGRTNDGVARVNLLAQGISGPALVTAVSGGQTPAPSSSTTSSTTATTSSTVPISGNVSARAGGLAPLAAAANSDTVTVTIGSALPANLVLVADNSRLTPQQPVRLRAIVLDARGNPVANVPVFFEILTPRATETLASGSAPRHTDNNGIAEDVIFTTAPASVPPRQIVVQATAANGVSNFVILTV